MAGKGGGKPGGKGGGKGLDKAQVKLWLKAKVREEVETLKREKALDLILLNKALGVGDMKTFAKEFEGEFKKSSQDNLKTPADKSEEKSFVYRKPKESRPRIKKVSTEVKPTKKKGKN